MRAAPLWGFCRELRLVGSRVYAIQVQDPAGRGKERLAEAMHAVERMLIPK